MKAEELMVGFWVRCTDPKPFRIREVDGVEEQVYGCDGFFVDISDLEPIPLTAEILEKNGFEKITNEGDVSAARFGRTPKPTGVWQYGFGQFDSVAYVPKRSFLRIKFMEGSIADIDDIKYVHELQHALRLFKVNKEIEL